MTDLNEADLVSDAVRENRDHELEALIASDAERAYRILTEIVQDVSAQLTSMKEKSFAGEIDRREYFSWRGKALWFQKHVIVWQRKAKDARRGQRVAATRSRGDAFTRLVELGVGSLDCTFLLGGELRVEFDAYLADETSEPFISGERENLSGVLDAVFDALETEEEFSL